MSDASQHLGICWHYHARRHALLFAGIAVVVGLGSTRDLILIAIGCGWASLMLSMGMGFRRGHCPPAPKPRVCWHFHNGNGYALLFGGAIITAAEFNGASAASTIAATVFLWAFLMLSMGSGFSRGCDYGICGAV